MNDNTNKQAVVNAIWQDPARVFGCGFRTSGKYQENQRGGEYDERGKIRLTLNRDGSNIIVFYNGSSRNEKSDVFTYLQDYVLHTAGFRDTLERCAQVYNIELNFTAEERATMSRQALAREVAPCFVEALRSNPAGEVAGYLNKRGLSIDNHFGELSPASIRRAVQFLRDKGKAYGHDDFGALGLTEERAAAGYGLILPYYRDGAVVGFLFRTIRENPTGPKYLFSTGLNRAGYCDRLATGKPAYIVEGEIDAIRLIQSGVENVVAMGGAQLNDATARLLKARAIGQVTYIPDLEYNDQGEQKTKLIDQALNTFLTARVDDEHVLNTLLLAELSAPDGADLRGLKIDVDDVGRERGGDYLREYVEFGAVDWWEWELNKLAQWSKDNPANASAFITRFEAIYNRTLNPYERERIKQYVANDQRREIFARAGVTPQALNDRDEWARNKEYTNRVKAAAVELNEAVEKGANPAVIGEIAARLSDAQATNTRDEWDKQLNETFDDELAAICSQPDTLKTKWTLGNITKDGKFAKYENIEFWPADITVFCAQTSHGKTMILFQSALDLVRNTDKTYLYVSCEENKRQLTQRALNVFLDIETTDTGKTPTGKYCFRTGTRKKTIKAILKGATPPRDYDDEFMGNSEHYNDLTNQVKHGVQEYRQYVRPRLKFIHTDATAEGIAANLKYYVEQMTAQGVEVGGVFVDYMQLLTSENKSYSRHDELKGVCKALKGCAARLEIPIIIAAQLNRQALTDGIDAATMANIGEGADIERIAHDIYFVWQVDKTKRDAYFKQGNNDKDGDATTWNKTAGDRARRIFSKPPEMYPNNRQLKTGYIYVEQWKARDGKAGGWGLFPYDGERGYIGENDTKKMAE